MMPVLVSLPNGIDCRRPQGPHDSRMTVLASLPNGTAVLRKDRTPVSGANLLGYLSGLSPKRDCSPERSQSLSMLNVNITMNREPW